MKRIGYIIYCAIFFALISAPLAFMHFSEYQMTENRPPAPQPKLFHESGLNFSLPGETEDYFMDRYAGRVKMVDAYSRVVGSLFGVSANERVIMGGDGWLFFNETMGDYDGSALLDDAEMELLIDSLLEIKREAESQGKVFIMVVAPNKNSIYGEFVPSRYYSAGRQTNLDCLMAVEELDLIDLRAIMLTHPQNVYFKTDTHWNGLGARYAAYEIMRVIEDKTGVRADLNLESGSYENVVVTGDLAKILFPASPPTENNQLFEDAEHKFRAIGRFRTLDDMNITTVSDGSELRVAMYRDSFAEALIPYISNYYSNVYYTRQTPPPLGNTEFLEADVIIFQVAERRIGELLCLSES